MPPSRAPVMLTKGFTSQVPRVSTSSMLQVPNKSLPNASIRKCQAYKTASNSQVPHKGLETALIHKCREDLQNASTHNCLPTASTHRCRIKACKLLQFPLARKTCEMLSTHHLLANCLKSLKCQELQTASILLLSTHAMLRRAMLRCVMLRYTMLRYAILHHAMLRPATQHHATLHHATLHHATLHSAMCTLVASPTLPS